MSFQSRTRLINPRLGAYFGIFASLFAALVLMLMMLEQLGTADEIVRVAMLVGPLGLFVGIGLMSFTREPLEFFAAGRRVPAVYCGLGLAISGLGATGLTAVTGLLFLVGIDAVWIVSGGLAGFVITALLLAPFLRKFGAYTLPTYLGRRFDSRLVRIVAAALFAIPTLLVLAAEIGIGARMAAWLTGVSPAVAACGLVLAVVAALGAGGMRALSWTNAAAAMAALLALTVPVTIAAILAGYLPLPILSHGPMLRAVGNLEGVQGLPIVLAGDWELALPGAGLSPVVKRFAEPFGTVGPVAYVLLTLTTMAGVAAAPWLLPRLATAPGVYEARKSLGWATFFFGLAMLTCATIAVFMRSYLGQVAGASIAAPPAWLAEMGAQGFAEVATRGTRIAINNVALSRDEVVLALPLAAGLPSVFVYLAATGIVAAAFAAASATALSIGNLVAEDILNGLTWRPQHGHLRLASARVMIAAVALFGGLLAVVGSSDPIKLVLWALAITSACGFPVLVASVWWKRVNVYGAFAALVVGFAVSILVIIAAEAGLIGLSSALAGVVGMPCAVLALVVVSKTTLAPSRHQLELVRDIRVPGGEILYDREMRLMKQKERKAGA
ncbi:MAG: sodium:solute symporter [Hyphomicrobiaceae bacterium]|nr:sodium:solute symporter [Hyphomicrobiaceae bacterium]